MFLTPFIVRNLPTEVLSRQARQPSGLLGRFIMTQVFNAGNADLNGLVKDCLELAATDRVLELGCGPGKLLADIAAITTQGQVDGVDFSRAMIAVAKRANRRWSDRVNLHHRECRDLPFADGGFDKIACTNTLYFWQPVADYVREIHRLLKPGGRVVIGFRDEAQMRTLPLQDEVFALYTQQDVLDLLTDCGLRDARIVERPGKPFVSYCAVAEKPMKKQTA